MTHQIQVAIPYYTALPEDVVTNVWHADWQGITPVPAPDMANLVNSILAFYEWVFDGSAGRQMAPFMRPALTRTKVYDLADPIPRVPVFNAITPLTVSSATNGQLPTECAIVASFHGAVVSGVSQARRRGRVYLGGLAAGAVATSSTTSFPRPTNDIIGRINSGMGTLKTTLESNDWVWSVYSTVNGTSTPVVGGWVDNTMDTQRRRGMPATTRSVWP